MMRKANVAAVSIAMLLTLTGCGNDPNRLDYVQLAKDAFASLKPASNSDTQFADPATVLAQIDAPLILATPQNGLTPFYLVGVRDNGNYRTYVTGTRQSFVFRQGILTATRGVGNDLMAADVTPTLDLVKAGTEGQARRMMQYLDAEDVTRDLVLDCAITSGPSGRTMSEECAGGDIRFLNTYTRNGAGRIENSTQWVSNSTGSISFLVLRP